MQPERSVLAPGTRIDAFSIQGTLGTGGFGITYVAEDLNLRRKVAIKEYCPLGFADRCDDGVSLAPISEGARADYETGRRRFLDEGQTLARFQDPHIVRVMRFLEANGTAYLIMAFEDGELLSRVVSRKGRLAEAEARPIAVRLLDGLGVVHAKKYLHRDIKPANVMIRADGHPVLLDFGAARLALESTNHHMTVMLTPGYAAFEQYTTGQPLGPWSDIYAVGATLFKCVTGRVPPPSTDRWSMIDSGDDPAERAVRDSRLALSDDFREALVWMLRPRATDRPQSVRAVLDLLAVPMRTGQAAPTAAPTALAAAPTVVAPAPPATAQLGAGTARTGEYERFTAREPVEERAQEAGGAWRGLALGTAAALALAAIGAVTGGWYIVTAKARPEAQAAVESAVMSAAASEPSAATTASAPEPVELDPGGAFRDSLRSGGEGPEVVIVPAGLFTIGSGPGEVGRDEDEGPLREIRIAAPLAVGRYEVSVAQFARFVSATGFITAAEAQPTLGCRIHDGDWRSQAGSSWRDPGYPQTDDHPVVCVSWDDAAAYIRWLSSETGEHYALPTESSWEYAARAETTGARFWGSDADACTYSNVSDLSRARLHGLATDADNVFLCADGHAYAAPVGSFSANPFGLHDVLGNVWEWTADCWASDYRALPLEGEPRVGAACEAIVFRGGSWINPPRFIRSASRAADPREFRYYNVGFRVVRHLRDAGKG